MSKIMKPLDYNTSGQDDLFLRSLRQTSTGLDDVDHDHPSIVFENITRSTYRDLERILSLPKMQCLDELTPHFFYSLFGTDRVAGGMLSPTEQRIVSVWFDNVPFDRARIPQKQRSTVIRRLKKLGLHLDITGPISMSQDFFTLREPTFFRSGMPSSTSDRVDNIIQGATSEFHNWLRMRFGRRRERNK